MKYFVRGREVSKEYAYNYWKFYRTAAKTYRSSIPLIWQEAHLPGNVAGSKTWLEEAGVTFQE